MFLFMRQVNLHCIINVAPVSEVISAYCNNTISVSGAARGGCHPDECGGCFKTLKVTQSEIFTFYLTSFQIRTCCKPSLQHQYRDYHSSSVRHVSCVCSL